jgi:hypothetical protein
MGVIALLISIIFIFLSGLHVYWGLFGIKNPSRVLPSNEKDELLMRPGRVGSILVGLILAFFGFIYLNSVLEFLNWKGLTYISWGIGTLFLARTIGDFRYVGFFKTVKNTNFAGMDSKFYSPLTLFIAALIFVLEFWG